MNDMNELDQDIEKLKEQDAKLDEQLRELEHSMRKLTNEDTGAVMFVFLAEILNSIKALQYKDLERQRSVIANRSKELITKREQLSQEKKVLVDKLVGEYRKGEGIDKEALKTLGLTEKTVENVLETVKTLEATQTFSAFDMLKQSVSELGVGDIIEDVTKDKLRDKATQSESDTDKEAHRTNENFRAKVRQRG